MAVDYEEGRRLLKAFGDAEYKWETATEGGTRHGAPELHACEAAEARLAEFMLTHAEALLNPDPWRPIEEAINIQHKEGVKYALAHQIDPDWTCLADGPPDEEGRWYCDGWHVEPTHFRELKGPGQ